MKRLLAVTQSVAIVASRGERRDVLDQRWTEFLLKCGLMPLPVPNHEAAARLILEDLDPVGLLLTGGNDLAAYGGDAPERDATEAACINWAMGRRKPIIAVCRGLQMLMHHFGVRLVRIDRHAGVRHLIHGQSAGREVNSYHDWGFRDVPMDFVVTGRAEDATIEAVSHVSAPVIGIMWHPEREPDFCAEDLKIFRDLFAEVR